MLLMKEIVLKGSVLDEVKNVHVGPSLGDAQELQLSVIVIYVFIVLHLFYVLT